MFESIIVRRHMSGSTLIDPGLLAEMLLFYQNVHLYAEAGLLQKFIETIGPENVIALIDNHGLSVTYSREFSGVQTDTTLVGPFHQFVMARIEAHQDGKKISNNESLREALARATTNTKRPVYYSKQL